MKATVTLIILVFCIRALGQSPVAAIKLEQRIFAKVRALPEVESFYHDAQKNKPTITLDDWPPNPGCYEVRVAISNFDQLRTNFVFIVNAKLKIYYLDTFTESGTKIITLEQWRRWRKTPAWQKIHVYKAGKFISGK